ncbi:HNH endonuclease [Streptomyces sp. SHP22-7]|nr:HNH endonuclease [Streptomyces sp. SHP22-7]
MIGGKPPSSWELRVSPTGIELPEHPGYVIYENGSIRGPRGKILKQIVGPTGYLFIRRWNGEKYLNLRTHSLVCIAFHGPRPTPSHQVRHLNGNKTDNRASNLAWGTPWRTSTTDLPTARTAGARSPARPS